MARDFNRDWALRLAESGLSVFPCGADKKPLVAWRSLSSCDPDAVSLWWAQHPNALPGIDLEKAGLLVLDGDRHQADMDGVAALRALLKKQPDFDPKTAPSALTPGDGVHVYFAQNGHGLGNGRGALPEAVDVRGAGGYVVAYAILPDGRSYRPVKGTPDLISAFKAGTIPHVPDGVVEVLKARKRKAANGAGASTAKAGVRERAYAQAALEGAAVELAGAPEGQRNNTLNAVAFRLARMVARGWIGRAHVEAALTAAMHANGYAGDEGEEAVAATLASAFDAGLQDPHPDLEEREEPQPKPASRPEPDAPPKSLAEVHAIFRKWLGADYDLDTLDAALAAAASERLRGDPLWLLVVSGPGNAKTETVQALSGAGAYVTSTIASEGALLSASSRRERNKNSTGGLLRKIGDRGLLVIKDVTSILSADRNTRACVLAAIREVYDGRWERNVGSEGGQTLTWTGRIVIVGATTTAWDTAHAVVATMGDRFVLVRANSRIGRPRSGMNAIRNTGTETAMRRELADAVAGIISHASIEEYQFSDAEIDRLVKAADIVTAARTGVERDYAGNVVDAHALEMPTRFAKQLAQVVRGAVAVGMTAEAGMRLAIRCARDSIPPLRLEILLDLASLPGSRPGDVRKRINRPWRTVKREMEGLHMLGLLQCDEEESSFGDDLKTIWRYSLVPNFDRDTLRAMTAAAPPDPSPEM